MKKVSIYLITLIVFCACTKTKKADYKIQPVDFTNVNLNDNFWAPKIEINRTISIPCAFGKCEETGRVDNFALAGGLIEGEHKGDFPFDDTDIYKILEGASYAIAVKYDEKLDHYLDSLITLVGAAQEDDGYLYTCLTNKCERLSGWYGKGRWDRLNSHELYNCGHLYEAAVAHFIATGKKSLLNIALKNADLICKDFGPNEGQKHVPSGHPIVEMALVKLYRVTGEKKYLDLAKYFIDETGRGTDGHELSPYSQDHMPIVEQKEAVGHAVRFGYLYSGVTDVAAITQNQEYIKALDKLWENVVSKKIYITGGIGSRAMGEGFGENYELPNMTSYCETCAAISNVYWNHRMFLLKGDAKYYDILERTLYNGVISGVSLSGDKFFYDNPLESNGFHERQEWFGCACCPGNITRFMASVPGYQYAVGEDGIYVNLFIQGDANLKYKDKSVKLTQSTQYPWNGKVEIIINENQAGTFELKVRIPGWARNEVLASDLYSFEKNSEEKCIAIVNGKPATGKIEKGYLCLKENWCAGDTLTIDIPMPVRKIKMNEKVYNSCNKVALQRGPIVYCVEQADNKDSYLFNFIIDDKAPIEEKFETNLLNGVVSLTVKGQELIKKNNKEQLIPKVLKAIPYYTWDNRGANKMLVWIPENKKGAIIEPKSTIASEATATSSVPWTGGVNDQFEPMNSSDTDKSFFYWWLKKGSEEWIQYDFDKITTISSSSIYWLNFNHYDEIYRSPENWSVKYLDGDEWKPVENENPYTNFYDQYNTVNFKPVKTKAIRISAQLQKDYSAGVLEWKLE